MSPDEEIQQLKIRVAELEAELTKAKSVLVSYSREVKNSTSAIKAASISTESYRDKEDDLRSTIENLIRVRRGDVRSIRDSARTMKELSAVIANQKRDLIELAKVQAQASREWTKIQSQVEFAAGGWRSYLKVADQMVKGVQSLAQGIVRLTTVVGASAISIDAIVKRYNDYRRAQFDAHRAQQLFGRGAKDISVALKEVHDNTILPKAKFLELTAAISKTYIGILPATREFANMASMLQGQFGPSMDVVIDKMKEMYELQADYPALQAELERGMKLLQSGHVKEAEAIKQTLLLRTGNNDALRQYRSLIVGSLSVVPAEVKKMMEAVESQSKVTQESEDALVALGVSGEKYIKLAADQAGRLYHNLAEIPDVAKNIGAIFATWNIASNILPSVTNIGASLTNLLVAIKSARTSAKLLTDIGVKPMMAKAGLGGTAQLGASLEGWALTKGTRQLTRTGAAKGAARLGMGALGKGAARFIPYVGTALTVAEIIDYMPVWFGGKETTTEMAAGGMTNYSNKRSKRKEIESYKAKYGKKFTDVYDVLSARAGPKASEDINRQYAIALKAVRKIERGLDAQGVALEIASKNAGKEDTELLKVQLKSEAINQSIAKENEMRQLILKSLGSQISYLEKVGFYNKNVYESSILASQRASRASEEGAAAWFETLKSAQDLVGLDWSKIEAMPDIVGKMSQFMAEAEKPAIELNKQILALEEQRASLPEDSKERVAIEGKISELKTKELAIEETIKSASEKTADIYSKKLSAIESIVSTAEAQYRIEKNMTGAYEERLNTERQLMESAQFGMGASVAMMQKQVELQEYMMQIAAQQDANLSERIKKEMIGRGISEDEAKNGLDAVKNAKSAAEARKIALQYGAKNADIADLMTIAYQKHNEFLTETMKRQQKIYDLTKDIREGYLQSIREMTVNGKEFSKIIGTQTKGATQLMKTIKEATGEYKLNTMALGGITQIGSPGYWARTLVTGRYLTGGGGLAFEGPEVQDLRNLDIYKYGEYAQRFMSGGPHTAGIAGIEVGGYIGAERQAELLGDRTQKGADNGTFNGMVRATDLFASKFQNLFNVFAAAINVRGPNTPSYGEGSGVNPDTLRQAWSEYIQRSPAPAPAQEGNYPSAIDLTKSGVASVAAVTSTTPNVLPKSKYELNQMKDEIARGIQELRYIYEESGLGKISNDWNIDKYYEEFHSRGLDLSKVEGVQKKMHDYKVAKYGFGNAVPATVATTVPATVPATQGPLRVAGPTAEDRAADRAMEFIENPLGRVDLQNIMGMATDASKAAMKKLINERKDLATQIQKVQENIQGNSSTMENATATDEQKLTMLNLSFEKNEQAINELALEISNANNKTVDLLSKQITHLSRLSQSNTMSSGFKKGRGVGLGNGPLGGIDMPSGFRRGRGIGLGDRPLGSGRLELQVTLSPSEHFQADIDEFNSSTREITLVK